MSFIYAMSDIHGELDIFKEALSAVDLTDSQNKLILLGDYIDGGKKSCETLYFIKELKENHPDQVIVLKGNHESMFLNQLFNKNYNFAPFEYIQLQQYISEKDLDKIESMSSDLPTQAVMQFFYSEMVKIIKEKHLELLDWVKNLPLYFETETQIFVHAGINESAGRLWKIIGNDEYYLWKYPHETGFFYKDIIAGHISTQTISKQEGYKRVFFDSQSHYFIDGSVNKTKNIAILKYDTETKKYCGIEKSFSDNGSVVWSEYPLN